MIFNKFLRGAFLLPIFFYSFILSAENSFYCSFYDTSDKFLYFLKSDKNNRRKDIFINLYNLPLKERVFRYDFPVRKTEAFTDGKENYYSYIQCNGKCSYKILFAGIKNGYVSVNGLKKGDISLTSSSDYAEMRVSFSSGIYFFSLVVDKRFDKFPILILSDSAVNLSKDKGFTANATASVVFQNYKNKLTDQEFQDRLYEKFCFPYCTVSDDNLYNEINSILFSGYSGKLSSVPLIVLLSRTAYDKEILSYLKSIGFSDSQLEWWKLKSVNGFCKE